MTLTANRARRLCRIAGVLVVAASAVAAERELRVCADPDNLPFSNDRMEGFDNKIAEVIAKDLNATVLYKWHPQRRGFIRQTLKAMECEVVMGVPAGYDLVLSTKPYYTSTYVFVSAKDRHLDVRSFDDPVLRRIKIGVHAFGEDGANSPPAHALGRRGIARNVEGFTILDTEESPPGRIIDAVAKGEIDVAIVWGPFAGYYAGREHVALEVTPVLPASDGPSLPFTFDMTIGVRRGDTIFKGQLEDILDRRRSEIAKILRSYGVPLAVTSGASTADSPQSAKK